MKRKIYIAAIFLAVLGALEVASLMFERRAVVEAAAAQAPIFEVDGLGPVTKQDQGVLWPKSASR